MTSELGGWLCRYGSCCSSKRTSVQTSAPQAVHVCDPELWSGDRKTPELAGFPAEPRQWVPASIRGSVSDKDSANKEHRRDHYFSFFLSKYLSLSLRYLNMKNVIDFFLNGQVISTVFY